jgi:ERCC4-type nuclease
MGSAELAPLIRKCGVKAEVAELPFGDFCFDGQGPDGRSVCIGVERKTLHDMLACIGDHRYAAHQLPGMRSLYDTSILIVEGSWRPHEDGFLMELFRGTSWGYCQQGRNKVMYQKLRRYLFSVSFSGVIVLYSRDPQQTAYDLCELFHWFSKPWHEHMSMLEMQNLVLPTLNGKPSLVREWAARLSGIGTKKSEAAEKLFKRPIDLALAPQKKWMEIEGIGLKTAIQIVREIQGG